MVVVDALQHYLWPFECNKNKNSALDEMNDVRMMTWWWGDRAWWVSESVFFYLPSKGIWTCLGDSSPGMPRRPETSFFVQKALLSSSRIVLRVTIAKGDSIHSTCETYCQTLYCRLFQGYHGQHQCLHCNETALAVPTLIRELQWHRCWTEEPVNWQSINGASLKENTLYTFTPTPMPSFVQHQVLLRYCIVFDIGLLQSNSHYHLGRELS